MNESVQTLKLWNYLTAAEGWGREAGARIRKKLEAYFEAQPEGGLWRISLQSVKRIDVAFASEAIVGLIDQYRATRRLCLVDLSDEDITENIAAAAERMRVPVTIWNKRGAQVLGLQPGAAAQDALAFALARPQGARAAEHAAAAGISIANASSRFKQLWQNGFLLRTPGTASSGGAEYIYRPIG